jgi:hypothetical protein
VVAAATTAGILTVEASHAVRLTGMAVATSTVVGAITVARKLASVISVITVTVGSLRVARELVPAVALAMALPTSADTSLILVGSPLDLTMVLSSEQELP